MRSGEPLRVGIAGLGAIGLPVARRLDAGIDGLALSAVSARDLDGARARVAGFASAPEVVPVAALADHADVVVECAPQAAFAAIVEPVARAGRIARRIVLRRVLDRLEGRAQPVA